MLLSIIIPNYNSGPLLEKSLRRLFQDPTILPFEVWVLDNCSTDGSTDFLIQEELPRVNLISQKDQGVYFAMNEGIRLAQGDWLYFLGAGDLFFPELVQPSDFSPSDDFIYAEVDQNPGPLRGVVTLDQILYENICHQGIFYRKSIFQQLGGYDPRSRLLADHLLNIRIFFNPAFTKRYLPITIARYLGGGISSRQMDDFFRENKKMLILREFLNYPTLSATEAVSTYFWTIARSKFPLKHLINPSS